MATRQYIGARYAPIFADPAEWDDTREYEPLTIVTHLGDSYTSRRRIPVGIDINDTTYWVRTGSWNAQTEAYRREVRTFDGRITANADAIAQEYVDRQNADDELRADLETQLAQEIEDREAADNDVTAAFEAADQNLQGQLDREALALSNAIQAEEDAREEQDANLADDILRERDSRMTADDQLQANIDNEANERNEADTSLANGIIRARNEISSLASTFDSLRVTSVRDHGAYGDGTHDDTQAFYDAIGTEGHPAPYDVVVIPAGNYLVSEWIYLHSNLIIIGPGTIINNCSQGGVFNWTCANSNNAELYNVVIDGVQFTSGTFTSGGNTYRHDNAGIQFYHGATDRQRAANVTIQNCSFFDMGWAAISVYSGLGTGGGTNHPRMEVSIINNKIARVGKNSRYGTMGVGIHILGSEARVIGNYVYGCNAECLTFDDGCMYCLAEGNTFWDGRGAGVVSCDEGRNLIFLGNHFRSVDSSVSCLRLNCGSGNVANCTITGNMFDGGNNAVSMGNDNSGYHAEVVTVSGNVCVGQAGQPIWCANNSRFSQGGNWANWARADAAYIIDQNLLKRDYILDIMYGGA